MIASISESLNIWAKAGIAPSLPFLILSRMNSSLRCVFISWGPLPAERPPSLWQKPQLAANSPLTSSSECSDGLTLDWGTTTVPSVTANRPTAASISGRDFIPPNAASLQAVNDEHPFVPRHALVGFAEVGREFVTEHAAKPGHDGDVLLAAGSVADDAALVAEAVTVAPQLGASRCVVGVNDPARIWDKNQIAGGREQAAERRLRKAHLPFLIAGDRVARIQMAIDLTIGWRRHLERRAEVQLGLRLGDGGSLDHFERHAPFLTYLVVHARSGTVGAGVPADAAPDKRAQRLCNLAGLEIATAHQFTGFRINRLYEIDVFDKRPHVLDLRVGTVVNKDEPAFIRVHDVVLAIAVEHDELANGTVEIPGIVRQFLVEKFQFAGIDIEPDNRARIKIVARTGAACFIIRARPVVERRGVGGAPPDRVAGGVEGAGHPAATAAGAPGLVTPSLQRLVGTTDSQKLPSLLAGRRVNAEDRAAIGPLSALGPDHDHALCIKRSSGEPDGELLRIDQLGVPKRFAGLHVERDEPPIDSADKHLALSDRGAAIVGRVSLPRDERLVELGDIGPHHLSGGPIEREGTAVRTGVID